MHDESKNRKFLTRNVIQKQTLLSKKAKCRLRNMPTLEDVLPRIQMETYKQHHLLELCELHFSKINSWANSMDTMNYSTSSASIQGYTVIVNKEKQVTIIGNGLSVISLSQQSLVGDHNQFSCSKKILVKSQELRNAESIYFAAVVKRMTVKEDRRGATRKANHSSSSSLSKSQNLEQLTRVGCIKMYEKDDYNTLNSGVQRMILVDRDEKPEFEVIFREIEHSGSSSEWLKQIGSLEAVHKENANKQFQDQHLPRLIFISDAPDLEETLEKLTQSPIKLPHQSRRNSFRMQFGRLSCGADNEDNSKPGTSTAIRNDERCSQLTEKKSNTQGSSKWFSSRNNNNENSKAPDMEYFKKDTVTIFENSCLYRPKLERSFQYGSSKRTNDEKETQSSPDISVSCEVEYGLDCAGSKGHMPYLRTVYKTRSDSLVPLSDEKERSNESYPVNNAKVFTDYELYEKKPVPIPKDLRREDGKMVVVEVPPTQAQIDSFNRRLVSATGKRVPRRIAAYSIHHTEQPGTDLDGRRVPTFSELVFPHGKAEIYDVLCRNYYAEVGYRPGTTSPEYRSRLLVGFINKHYEHVFTHKLEPIFEKQLHLIGTSTPGWNGDLHQQPLDRIRELKSVWNKRHQEPTRS
uniref:PH domain-containing protein n=1 Tax=Caenorhabditis tropicalis TaxID=1561998 RepID=A0A1I7UB08_9PELO